MVVLVYFTVEKRFDPISSYLCFRMGGLQQYLSTAEFIDVTCFFHITIKMLLTLYPSVFCFVLFCFNDNVFLIPAGFPKEGGSTASWSSNNWPNNHEPVQTQPAVPGVGRDFWLDRSDASSPRPQQHSVGDHQPDYFPTATRARQLLGRSSYYVW